MITECVTWLGLHSSMYQDELDQWMEQDDNLDRSTVLCSEIHPQWMDNGILMDTGGMLDGRTVMFLGAQEWDVDWMAYVLAKLQGIDVEVRVGMVYQGAVPTPKVYEYVTGERDHRIPRDESMAPWLASWLDTRDIKVSIGDAHQVADHVGYDVEQLVVALRAIVDAGPGTVSASDLIARMGAVGEGNLWDLNKAICRGDRAAVGELMVRLRGQHPLVLLKIMTTRFRAHAVAWSNPDATLQPLEVGDAAAWYVRREAEVLSAAKIVRGLQVLAQAEADLKGGSKTDPWLVIRVTADTLARMYRTPRRERR